MGAEHQHVFFLVDDLSLNHKRFVNSLTDEMGQGHLIGCARRKGPIAQVVALISLSFQSLIISII
jgi:hypothetical protein